MELLKKTSSISLKVKLIALSVGITFLLGIASVSILEYVAHTQKKDHLRSFEIYARTLSDAISSHFFERYMDVQIFSMNPSILSTDRQVLVDALNAYSQAYSVYDLIMLVDISGRLVAVTSQSPEGKGIPSDVLYQKNFSDAPWFKASLSGEFTEDRDKGLRGTYVEDVQIDPWVSQVYGGSRLGSSFSTAIKDRSGKIVGVITNRAGARWFEVAFREFSSSLKKVGYSTVELMLIRKDGTLLYELNSKNNEYDWNRILKFNLAQSSVSAQLAVKGGIGAGFEKNPYTGKVDILGYSFLNNAKFIDKIGWSILVRESIEEVLDVLSHARKLFYLTFSLITGLTCVIFYFFSTHLSNRLISLATQLSLGSDQVSNAASSISFSSTQLSDSTTEQAAAIQETAASIDEMSAMIKKSSENANQSQQASQLSREAAERGQKAVQEMIQSILEISKSNSDIMSQVAEGNEKIADIVKVIAEIETKTKVINDIVFQTRLLSFNASVEAARAGEHGKGFSVVAEEVGNLAQMSGSAAKEISSMLESSIQKVQGIADETKSTVEHLVIDSKAKVEAGTQVTQKCGEALNNILSSVHQVDGMVGEISSASQEQSQGVSEINRAVNQLDQVTQKNTSIALESSNSAGQLNKQAAQLRQMVQDLFVLINGNQDTRLFMNKNELDKNSMEVSRDKSLSAKNEGRVEKEKFQSPTRQVLSLDRKRLERKNLTSQIKKSPEGHLGEKNLSRDNLGNIPSKDDPRFVDV